MTFAKESLIDALRLRYDYYSAASMYEIARERAGLPDKPAFDATELRAFRGALVVVGDRVNNVVAQLDGWLADAPAPSSKPAEPKPTESKKEAKAADDKPTETTIVVTGVPVADGEEVLVCGGAKDLGDWDPDRARAMTRKDDAWSTTIKLTSDAKVALKFLRRTADGEVIWEDGDDRELVPNKGLEATWRR